MSLPDAQSFGYPKEGEVGNPHLLYHCFLTSRNIRGASSFPHFLNTMKVEQGKHFY